MPPSDGRTSNQRPGARGRQPPGRAAKPSARSLAARTPANAKVTTRGKVDLKAKAQAQAKARLDPKTRTAPRPQPRPQPKAQVARPIDDFEDEVPKAPEPKASRLVWTALGAAGAVAVCGLMALAWFFIAPPQPPVQPPPLQAAAPAAPEAPPPANVRNPVYGPPANPPPPPPGPDFLGAQAAAQAQLEAAAPEIHGLLYRNVKTDLSGPMAAPQINFCGEVNSLSPAGLYVGFQRFVSSAADAKLETFMTPGDFDQTWRTRCNGRIGPKVWN